MMAKLFGLVSENGGIRYTFDAEQIGAVRSATSTAVEVYVSGCTMYAYIDYDTFCTAWRAALKQADPGTQQAGTTACCPDCGSALHPGVPCAFHDLLNKCWDREQDKD